MGSLCDYFKKKKYQLLFFKIIGFNKNEITTFKIVTHTKRRTARVWYINNLIFPLTVIFLPYTFTLLHYMFNTINFNKSIQDICISGALTILGINVLRTSSTVFSEKNKHENVPQDLLNNINEVEQEINAIKKRLAARSWLFSIIGMFLYLAQICNFIKNDGFFVYIVITAIVIISMISIILGRFISLLETNIFETEDAIRLIFQKLVSRPETYENLKSTLTNQGLL